MLIKTDNHFHSTCSTDGRSPMPRMIERLYSLGITHASITDHYDADPADDGFGFYDYEKIHSTLAELRRQYRMKIFHGIEITYQPQFLPSVEKFIDTHFFDLIIGSVHYIDGILIRQWSAEAGDSFGRYFDLMLELSSWQSMNVLGHLDYLKKYTERYSEEIYIGKIERILANLIKNDKALGINTSGFRHRAGEQYPSQRILSLYYNMGGRLISIGSDSHHISHAGTGYGETAVLLKKIGYKEQYYFSRGIAQALPL